MVVVARARCSADHDTRFQTAIANDLPAFLVNPSKRARGERRRARPARLDRAATRADSTIRVHEQHGRARSCRRSAPRPTSPATSGGSTRRAGAALPARACAGKVVLVDFWTYTCINCIRTLPYLKAWDERYRDEGLVIVGVHTPEFPFERDAGNVADAIGQNGHPLPGRPGQRLRHLERLRQPVLAGEVPDRRQAARCATCTSARATTTRPRARSARLLAEAGRGARRACPRERRAPLEADQHARELPRRRARRPLRERPDPAGHADVRAPRRAACRRTTLAYRRHAGGSRPTSATAVRGARLRAGLRRAAGLPRARLARRRAAAGARAARRQPAARPAGGRRRARRAGG